jgi:hypothetical protein
VKAIILEQQAEKVMVEVLVMEFLVEVMGSEVLVEMEVVEGLDFWLEEESGFSEVIESVAERERGLVKVEEVLEEKEEGKEMGLAVFVEEIQVLEEEVEKGMVLEVLMEMEVVEGLDFWHWNRNRFHIHWFNI